MIILNLKTNDSQQERLKAYLQENVSDSLAQKINKGVLIEKDGKTFLSKKDLDGFLEFACKTAQEQAEKGKRSAMVEDSVVFGWAMHYFEEDSIEGKLFNPDGTPYTPPKPKYTPSPVSKSTPPVKKPDVQPNMFDLLSDNKNTDDTDVDTDEETDDDEITEEEKQEAFEELNNTVKPSVSPIYEQYLGLQRKYQDCVIAYRLGDFYEVFGDNAVKISDRLDLTLTGRDVGLPERIPMIGFPYHAADVYFQKIINVGYKIAIAENTNDVKIIQHNMKIDTETGEILNPDKNDLLNVLTDLFGNTMEIRL